MARALVASETFSGTENPLAESGSWTSKPGTWAGNLQKASGIIKPALTSTHSAARLETTVAHNQYIKLTNVNADAATVVLAGACSRMQADGSCYALYYYPNANVCRLYRFDAGTFTAPLVDYAITPASNITLELRSVGTTHYCYFNGVLQGTPYQDATYLTGKVGVAAYNAGGGTGVSIPNFEAGTTDGRIDDFGLDTSTYPNFSLFEGTENPLSESAAWLIPTINAGSDASRHWYDGLQKSDKFFGRVASQHNVSYRSGSYQDNQYAAIVIGSNLTDAFAGPVTRMISNGNCYFAFWFPTDNTIKLYYYDNSQATEGFYLIQSVAWTIGSGMLLLELQSSGNTHTVYATNLGGSRTQVISTTDSHYPTGGAPGATVFGSPTPFGLAFWGGNIGGTVSKPMDVMPFRVIQGLL